MKTATRVRFLDTIQPRHMAALYKLSDRLKGFDYVVVSAVIAPYVHETCIFGCNEHGEVIEQLPGSLKDVYSHEKALNNAGYEMN